MKHHIETAKLWAFMALYILAALLLDYAIFGPQHY
jgi:hypothetical protein